MSNNGKVHKIRLLYFIFEAIIIFCLHQNKFVQQKKKEQSIEDKNKNTIENAIPPSLTLAWNFS